MTTLTTAQERDWPLAIARLKASGADVPEELAAWDVHYYDEVRPGRGHSISAQFVDGEVYAQILMDVYGYPSTSYATLDWQHADSDEECECGPCVRARDEED